MTPPEISPFIAYLFSFFFFMGLFLDFSLLRRKNEEIKSILLVPWKWIDLGFFLLIFLGLGESLSLFLKYFLTILKISKDDYALYLCLFNILIEILVVVFLIRWLKKRYLTSWKDLGFNRTIHIKDIYLGALYYIAVLPPLIVIGLITKILADAFKVPIEPQAPMKMLMREHSNFNYVIMGVLIVVFAPVLEEIFFRGFVYPLMRNSGNVKRAILLSAFIFASLHFSLWAFLPITCIGYFLASLYERTGSLYASITFHVLNNLMTVLIVFFLLK